jgi:hypothetical protein
VDLSRGCRLGCWAALGLAGLAILNERAAYGREVAAQLDYAAAPGCPVAGDLEAVVAARLGYSPFRPDASERVVVRIEAPGQALEGRVEWRNAAGQWMGERTFPSRSRNCGELVQAMGFALAVQVQLMAAESFGSQPPAAPAVIEAPPATPPVDARREIRVSPPESGPIIALGAGASVGIGLAPSAIAVLRLFGGVAWSRVAVELGAELSVPSTLHRTNGSGFSEQILLGSLAGCGLRPPWSACLVTKAGEVRVAGEGVDFPARSSGVLVQAGLRLAATYVIGRRVHISAHADGLAMVTRGVVTLDAMAVWSTPRVAADLGVDVGVRFP